MIEFRPTLLNMAMSNGAAVFHDALLYGQMEFAFPHDGNILTRTLFMPYPK